MGLFLGEPPLGGGGHRGGELVPGDSLGEYQEAAGWAGRGGEESYWAARAGAEDGESQPLPEHVDHAPFCSKGSSGSVCLLAFVLFYLDH